MPFNDSINTPGRDSRFQGHSVGLKRGRGNARVGSRGGRGNSRGGHRPRGNMRGVFRGGRGGSSDRGSYQQLSDQHNSRGSVGQYQKQRGGDRGGRGSNELVRNYRNYVNVKDVDKTIRISNLPKESDKLQEQLQKIVSKCVGPVKHFFYHMTELFNVPTLNAICVFEDVADSCRALRYLHGQLFHGHHLLVRKWYFSILTDTPFSRCSNIVCVKNLPEEASEEDLWKLFKGSDINMIQFNRHSSPFSAVIKFGSSCDVKSALQLDGTQLCETAVKVIHLNRDMCVDVKVKRTRFKDLEAFLANYNVTYMLPVPQTPKEWKAYVFLADEAEYQELLSKNNPKVKDSQLAFTPVFKPTERGEVYFSPLPQEINAEDIVNSFGFFGKVSTLIVPFMEGVGKLVFKDQKSAKKAIEATKITICGNEVGTFQNIPGLSSVKKEVPDINKSEDISGHRNEFNDISHSVKKIIKEEGNV